MQSISIASLTSLLVAGVKYFGFDSHDPSTTVLDQVIAPWNWTTEDGTRPPCDWANSTTRIVSPLCNNFAISRTPGEALQTASERALRCAADGDTSCVFASEVGLAVPSVFVPDDSPAGLRLLIAPRVLTRRGDPREVQMLDPRSGRPGSAEMVHEDIVVEALAGGVRNLEVLELKGRDAYCVQFMWSAMSSDCATTLG